MWWGVRSADLQLAPHSPELILRGARVACVHAHTVNNEEMSQPLAYAYSLASSSCHTNMTRALESLLQVTKIL